MPVGKSGLIDLLLNRIVLMLFCPTNLKISIGFNKD